jgi:uncharacterized membrane protein (DUF4010 family)
MLVLLISSLSLVGYVATRLLGARRGIPLTGLTGGLVSSTALNLFVVPAACSLLPPHPSTPAASAAHTLS